MQKQLLVNSELCTGCGLCELACAIKKTGQCHPALARIKVWRDETKGIFIPLTCQQCVEAPCANACLMNLINKDPHTKLTVRQLEMCIGCRTCQVACPFEASVYDYLQEVVVNCDHCGGDPECVRYCPTGALQYGVLSAMVDQRRSYEAAKQVV